MIIDAHVHLGYDVCFDIDNTEELLYDWMGRYNIDGGIVQPFVPRPYIEDYKAIHDRIYQLTKSTQRQFWGMSSMNPHFKLNDYADETERCIKQLGFKAVKITPIGHACNPMSKDGLAACDVVRQLGVPLMIHTGNGGSFADPIQVAKVAEMFPDLTIVMAHAGSGGGSVSTAAYIAATHDNVILEPSWVDVASMVGMVKQLGASKIMFSSDTVENIPVELAIYETATSTKEELDQILYKTARDVFKLDV